jgi:glycerophosphoryl diester phosphodiesterase
MHPFFDLETPLVIGHRGAAGEMPENTLASFERGLADGATVLESDVHLTRDGVPVLIHDDDVDRCTEGRGAVRDFDLAELKKLDAGYRFEREGDPEAERGRGHTIATLEEALVTFPGARFNLELKEDRPGWVERTVDVVAAAGRAELTLVTTADHAPMARLRAYVASRGVPVALGACAGEVAGFAVAGARGETPPPGPMALQIPTEFAGQPLVTEALVVTAHAYGAHVHVWTINDAVEMQRLFDLGVDGIVSDFPARVAAVVAARRV